MNLRFFRTVAGVAMVSALIIWGLCGISLPVAAQEDLEHSGEARHDSSSMAADSTAVENMDPDSPRESVTTFLRLSRELDYAGAANYPPGIKLYENQLTSRADSPAHLGSFAIDILRLGRIRDTWEPAKNPGNPVAASMTMTALMEMAQDSPQNLFPVVNQEGVLVGELSIDDIRRALLSEAGNLIVAMDLMRPVVGPLTMDDHLARAAKLLADRETDAVTVVQDLKHPEVLGTFSWRDLIVAYGMQLEQMKKLE